MLAEKLAYDHHVVPHEVVFANLLEIHGATSPTPTPVAAESVEARMSSQVVQAPGWKFKVSQLSALASQVRWAAIYRGIFLEQITNRYWCRSWSSQQYCTTYMHAYMHACMYAYVHAHIHTSTHMHTSTHTHIHTYTHTHTYLLRTVIANFDVECILRAKTPTVNWHEEWKIIIIIHIIYIYIYLFIFI